MDDLLKKLLLGLATLTVLHTGVNRRAERVAASRVRAAFDDSGTVRVRVRPHGEWGLLAADIGAIEIYGVALRAEHLPLYVSPHSGSRGRIRHLIFHLRDFTLFGHPIDRFDADIPDLAFDLREALFHNRLVLCRSGVGAGVVQIGESSLKRFIQYKFKKLLSDIDISITETAVYVSGKVLLFGGPTPFTATGRLIERDGRYVEITDPLVQLRGVTVSQETAGRFVQQINPVLDIVNDLGLEGYFRITAVQLQRGIAIIRGGVTIPSVDVTVQEKPWKKP